MVGAGRNTDKVASCRVCLVCGFMRRGNWGKAPRETLIRRSSLRDFGKDGKVLVSDYALGRSVGRLIDGDQGAHVKEAMREC
jgi:hypothetical protein